MINIFKKEQWFSNVKNDVLAGAVVALALIPEAIAFSIIAGVDPKVGLYASFCIAIVTAFTGGRPAMISAATGAMALLMTTLVRDYGLDYLLATTVLTGILQIVLGWIKLGNQMRFVPRAVMIGFVNALAILIFNAQLPQLQGVSWIVYAIVAAGLLIIYGLPRLTRAIPSPLVAIVVLTVVANLAGWTSSSEIAASAQANLVPTVGDMGTLPTSLPLLRLPSVPLNLETIEIILPYALALSLVGLMESFLTANVVDDMTDTASNKNQEAVGQGTANIVAGFFGGMAGCAMIGQSVINVRSGGRTRLSTLCSGLFLILFILGLGEWVAQIPMGALVAVMFMVSFSTFSWNSLRNLRVVPKSETAVMVTTVVVTILTHNLAIGVIVGVAMSAIFFSRKIADIIHVESTIDKENSKRIYRVDGQLFFASVDAFINSFDFHEHVDQVLIDLSSSHLWDQSAVDSIDKVVLRFRRQGANVDLVGLNAASATLLDRLAVHHKSDGTDMALH